MYVIFALTNYLTFMIVGNGHLLAVVMATTATVVNCLLVWLLGKLSDVIANARRSRTSSNSSGVYNT